EEFRRRFPEGIDKNESVAAVPMRQEISANARPMLLVLMGAVALVLLIACANIANLLLARGLGRQKTFAIRAWMGASRLRLVKGCVAESILLSLIGGMFGLGLSYWGVRGLLLLIPENIPRLGSAGSGVGVDWRVLLFTLGVAALTGIVFGTFPGI